MVSYIFLKVDNFKFLRTNIRFVYMDDGTKINTVVHRNMSEIQKKNRTKIHMYI